jgi:hypothetical protein
MDLESVSKNFGANFMMKDLESVGENFDINFVVKEFSADQRFTILYINLEQQDS